MFSIVNNTTSFRAVVETAVGVLEVRTISWRLLRLQTAITLEGDMLGSGHASI